VDEEKFAALRGSPFVGADGAVGSCNVARVGEGIGRVWASGVGFLVFEV